MFLAISATATTPMTPEPEGICPTRPTASAPSPTAKWPSTEQREDAVNNRDVVAGRMTPDDLSEAQRFAREWDAAHPRETSHPRLNSLPASGKIGVQTRIPGQRQLGEIFK